MMTADFLRIAHCAEEEEDQEDRLEVTPFGHSNSHMVNIHPYTVSFTSHRVVIDPLNTGYQ
eukprot:3265863-Pyramimonas_sp.AAC.1